MSFDWFDYLELSKELESSAQGSALEEAKLRSAISRAYYALFCSAKNYLSANRPYLTIPRTGMAHDFVKDAFLNDNSPDMIAVGVTLNRLKINRHLADYENQFRGLVQTARISMQMADSAKLKLDSL